MPLRRQHENSHIGCAQCKRRRVRCDEGRPICKRCIKYGGRCEYLAAPTQSGSVEKTPTSSLHSDTPESGGIQGPSSSVVSLSIQQPVQPTITKQPANENLPDTLELMHYYTASTYLTISDSLEFQPIWQHTVPREALAHDFLMHGILALAALHIAHVRPDQKDRYVSSALRHNDTALVSFRVALQQVTKENCDALFGFSTILLVLTLAFAQTHSHLKEHDPIEDLIQVFTLLQGTRSVLDSAMRWIATGPLGPLVRRGLAARNRNPSAVSASKGPAHPTEQALNRLENCSQRSIESPSSREVYSLAIQKLKGCAARAREHPGDRAAVIGWLVLLQTEYIASVKSREPVALAILGHYGVLLDTLKEEWFVMDLGMRIVEAVYERIPEEWRPSMDWAIQQVGSRPPGLEEIELA